MIEKKPMCTNWTAEDEREHPTSHMEWWAAEAFLSTDSHRHLSCKAALIEWRTKGKEIGSNYIFTVFNQDEDVIYAYDCRDDQAKLSCLKDVFDIRFRESWIKGTYPKYEMRFFNPKHDIEIQMRYTAISNPRWVAQEATNGWLPMGLGFYRYGFIPRCNVEGVIRIQKQQFSVVGQGYFEHIWGDITYHRTGSEMTGLKKSIKNYISLAKWWFSQNRICVPNTIAFTSENNPFGYDWAWAIFDNGWSLFYGNILLWIMEGPAAGSIIFSKDGKSYEEFANVRFTYTKTKILHDYNVLYPTEFMLTARKNDKFLHLQFSMIGKVSEYVLDFIKKNHWLGLAICESPGIVQGFYIEGNNRTDLKGVCKIEPQRQLSKWGHNALIIQFLKPPKGVGVVFNVEFNVVKKRIIAGFECIPKPNLIFKIHRL